ncbi:MAG: glycerol-3-phosphate dehydrogenase [Acidobacteria bacterium]|nr:glycerol-3-phosphate dehydrogenase [Acidobacteriota bacterium]MCA1627444.1 glycerol-3-phosphate dehydrogenase [Acidobacteriota bacterium]
MNTNFDVIVIGAGINGAGIARDAAMRGLRVLLIDKGDVAGGTSAASTRLIHGGLRYLEHFGFGLVRESLKERETLLRIAPHLVRPLAITIPVYKQSRRGRGTIRAGMIAYDLLSLGKSLPRHRVQSARETLKQVPGLNGEGLVGSAVYYDAQVEFAERLVVENVLDAIERGAKVLLYTRVTKLLTTEHRVTGVQLEGNSKNIVKADFVVNAAGPWVDEVVEANDGNRERLVGGTKGSHVVVAPFAGAPESAVYLEAVSDGRPFFIIPWNANYLIGTTDVRFEDAPENAQAEPWEVEYLINETNRAFAKAGLTRESVLYTYSGVRPLRFTTNEDEQKITRRHFLREHPRFENLVSVVGGKLTTYRSLAEECVDLVLRKLGRGFFGSGTATTPLPGAIDFAQFARRFNEGRERWLRIYGSRAKEVAALAERVNGDVLAAEVVFAFEQEFAKTLADCFLRRTMIGFDADLGLSKIEAAVNAGVRWLGWSEECARGEVESYREEISSRLDHRLHHRH